MKRNIEQEIRENWFKNHIATLEQHGDLEVLIWREPGTTCYSCRYVFDGDKMYISGDIGAAVFWLTWKADVHSFYGKHINYFYEKLEAYSGDRYDFNNEKAIKQLREWLKDMKEYVAEYDHNEMKELFDDVRNCSSYPDWIQIWNDRYDFLAEIDPDCAEQLHDLGSEITARVQGYLIGLKMASEQLKKQ